MRAGQPAGMKEDASIEIQRFVRRVSASQGDSVALDRLLNPLATFAEIAAKIPIAAQPARQRQEQEGLFMGTQPT